jgi:hypothetical protein
MAVTLAIAAAAAGLVTWPVNAVTCDAIASAGFLRAVPALKELNVSKNDI